MARVLKTDANRALATIHGHSMDKANKRHKYKRYISVLRMREESMNNLSSAVLRRRRQLQRQGAKAPSISDDEARSLGYEIFDEKVKEAIDNGSHPIVGQKSCFSKTS